MVEASVLTLALLGLAMLWTIARRMSRHTFSWFHPLVILWLLAAWDVYIPAILWAFGVEPRLPPWISTLRVADLVEPLLFYLLFVLLMSLPIAMMTVKSRAGQRMQWRLRWGALGIIALLCLFLAVFELWLDVAKYGGWEEWFWGRAKIRWAIETSDRTLTESVLSSIPWRTVFNVLAFVGFYYSAGLSGGWSRVLYRWVFPAVALALSLSTFYRGSILLTVVGFLFLEFIRRRLEAVSGTGDALISPSRGPRRWRLAGSRRVAVVGAALAVGAASFYGVLRDSLGRAAWEGTRQVDVVTGVEPWLSQMFQGAGLTGVAWIYQEYGRNVPLWRGETYLDAVFLPVPRSLYPAKPERPGLLKITAALGESESTQSAVTIPGEAFANFGYWGLALAPLFGVMFALLFRFTGRVGTPELFLYPGVVFYVLLVGNWMSFTGMMNQLPSFVWSWVALRAILRRR